MAIMKSMWKDAATCLQTKRPWGHILHAKARLKRLKRRIQPRMDAKRVASPAILRKMAFRFRKRLNLGGGLGLNISKSGISPSLRTKLGTVSTRGYSVRTGIKGLTYSKRFSKARGTGCSIIPTVLLLLLIITFTIITL
jgi:hypothetical protein